MVNLASPSTPPLSKLTSEQREIVQALQNGGMTHVMDRPPDPGTMFWKVGVGMLGVVSLITGIVMVFFFAALGTIMMVLGAVTCGFAFQLGAPYGSPGASHAGVSSSSSS